MARPPAPGMLCARADCGWSNTRVLAVVWPPHRPHGSAAALRGHHQPAATGGQRARRRQTHAPANRRHRLGPSTHQHRYALMRCTPRTRAMARPAGQMAGAMTHVGDRRSDALWIGRPLRRPPRHRTRCPSAQRGGLVVRRTRPHPTNAAAGGYRTSERRDVGGRLPDGAAGPRDARHRTAGRYCADRCAGEQRGRELPAVYPSRPALAA
jgi:hypothetical protein